jgi:hypothetical protein
MLHRLMLEQYGIPKERDYWFYDTSHGFWSFPSFLKNSDGTMNPLLAMTRVYSQEVFGKTYQAALDFGTIENDHYIGCRFTGSDGTSVVALISGGRTDGTVKLQITGSTTVTLVDCFGNTSTLTCDSKNLVTVPVTLEPCYVRLGSGVTAVVEQVVYGPNVARWGASPTAVGTINPRRVVDGVLENSYYAATAEPTEWRDDATLPTTLRIDFAEVGKAARRQRIDCVVIDCPTPWQEQGTLLDYDLEYLTVGGVWTTIATVTEPKLVSSVLTNQSQLGCYVETYHSGRSLFVHRFSVVTATAIRLTVRDCTFGGGMDQASVDAGGQTGAHKLRIREVSVYSGDALVSRPVVLF